MKKDDGMRREKHGKDSVRNSFEKLYQPDFIPDRLKKDYDMLSCLKHTEERQVYLLTGKWNGAKMILKRGTGLQAELLEREYTMLERFNGMYFPKPVLFFYEEGTAYSLRTYIEGRTLFEIVENFGELSEKEAVDIILEVAKIIQFLHSQTPPVIYRDMKPQNVVMTQNSQYYLIDLDTARDYRENAEGDTMCLGTKGMASPEQFGFWQTDRRTDIYGLGMLLLFLLTGGHDKKAKCFSRLSARMKYIIEKCTSFAPAKRYQSVAAFIKALKGLERSRRYFRYGMLVGICILGIVGVMLIGRLCGFFGETDDMYSFLEKAEEQDLEVKKAVTFENASIEAGVRKALHKSENASISQAELEQVTALILCGDKVFTSWEEHMSYHNDYWYEVEEQAVPSEPCNNLSDLKNLKNLRVLVLDNQGIEYLPDLSGLPLQKVSLCSNQLTDISVLSKNTGIQVLWLKKNPLPDLTGLASLTRLTEIDISDTQVSDVEPLKKAPLSTLYCEYTNVDNREVIEEFADLSALRISHADENAIKMVSGYTNLHMLALYDSQVTTLKSFRNLKKLESLDLSGCETLMHLEGVEQLANLNYLGISETGVNVLPEDFMMEKLEIIDLHGLVIDDYTPLLHSPKLKLVYTGIEAQKRVEYQLLGENIKIQSF